MKTVQCGLILFVEKYEECVAFYRDTLTLEVAYDKESLTCFRFGSAYLMVESGGIRSDQEKPRRENPAVLRFDVGDLDVAAAELEAKGVHVDKQFHEWGHIGVFTDPDGNRCELKRAPAQAERHRQRQETKLPLGTNTNPMEITAEHDPRSGFRFLKFSASGQTRPASAIVYLHGAGERGNELSMVTRFGLPAMLAEGRAVTNCTVFCPQIADDEVWGSARLARFIRAVGEQYESVALIGFSLGASGVCSLMAEHGAVVAFAMAIAGQGPDTVQVSQAGVRLLAIQGELDAWPNTSRFLASVRSAGGEVVEVELAGKGHFISEEALANPTAVSMLLAAGIRISAVNAG